MLAIITLLLGIVIGLLSAFSVLWIFKIKCPKCKKPQPLKEIILFSWKSSQITGQPCSKCRKIKPQVEIF